MTDLFQVPESLSPRLKWMREKGVRLRTTYNALSGYHNITRTEFFCAWMPSNDLVEEAYDQSDGEWYERENEDHPDIVSLCGFGDTEEEACADLCRVNKMEGWK